MEKENLFIYSIPFLLIEHIYVNTFQKKAILIFTDQDQDQDKDCVNVTSRRI